MKPPVPPGGPAVPGAGAPPVLPPLDEQKTQSAKEEEKGEEKKETGKEVSFFLKKKWDFEF